MKTRFAGEGKMPALGGPLALPRWVLDLVSHSSISRFLLPFQCGDIYSLEQYHDETGDIAAQINQHHPAAAPLTLTSHVPGLLKMVDVS